MNRRGFIGTITALAGLALAKIKAPAVELKRRGVTQLRIDEPLNITGYHKTAKGHVVFTDTKMYTYAFNSERGGYGWREWKRGTCHDCALETYAGYEPICTCSPVN